MSYHTYAIRRMREGKISDKSAAYRLVYFFKILRQLYGTNHASVLGFYKFLGLPVHFSGVTASRSFRLSRVLIFSLVFLIRTRRNLGLPDFTRPVRVFNSAMLKLQQSKSYRALRHKQQLPVRGQRTKTNRKTQRRFKRL